MKTAVLALILPIAAVAANVGTIVLVDSRAEHYRDYAEFTQLYLNHFDLPRSVWDVASKPLTREIGDASLVVVAHEGVSLEGMDPLRGAIEAGLGVVSFDGRFGSVSCAPAKTGRGEPVTILSNTHYIAARKQKGEQIPLRGELPVAGCGTPAGFEVLARVGERPLIVAGSQGAGRVVVFSSYAWLDPQHLGFFGGMDDLIWRSFVWAARKPFIMQGMPPLVSFRIDDCFGGRDRDWAYIDGINAVGIVPHGTFFLDEIDEAGGRKMAELVKRGKLQVSIHARRDAVFYWWDHYHDRPLDDVMMRQNFRDGMAFFRKYGIQPAKSLNIHWEEMGPNTAEYMRQMGIEFVVSWTNFGMAAHQLNRFHAAPYLLYREPGWWKIRPSSEHTGQLMFTQRAVMDYLDERHWFFDSYVEPMDIKSGSDWLRKCSLPPFTGTFEDAGMVLDATTMLKRELDSMFPAYYFTHEVNINRYEPAHFGKLVRAVWGDIAGYRPEPVSYDDLNRYARAQFDSHMDRATYDRDENQLTIRLTGKADIPTRFWVYTSKAGGIAERMESVPPFKGAVEVRVKGE
ncbi:MAG TPA: hypothetical protein VN442_04680 [Bryobacteraceae bacterium]|nr:hypothetical protein [Bryobacteraceae bacterium]